MGISKQEQDLIERFESAYNEIHQYMIRTLQYENQSNRDKITFGNMVREMRQRGYLRRLLQEEIYSLMEYHELRNAIVHEKRSPYEYIAVPKPSSVDALEQLCRDLLRPELIVPRFKHDVITVRTTDKLSDTLRTINQKSYSQFPVYDENGAFCGLLTANGIVRWLSQHVATVFELVELEDHTVAEALQVEERVHRNYLFVSAWTPIKEAVTLHAENPTVEALIITQNARENETPIGIITSDDILQILKSVS